MAIYARIGFSEDELNTVRGAVISAQAIVREKAVAAQEQGEKDFYWSRVAAYEPLVEKLNRPFLADQSQDADDDDAGR